MQYSKHSDHSKTQGMHFKLFLSCSTQSCMCSYSSHPKTMQDCSAWSKRRRTVCRYRIDLIPVVLILKESSEITLQVYNIQAEILSWHSGNASPVRKALLQELGWPMEMILWHSDNISQKWGELHNRILARRWKLFTDTMVTYPQQWEELHCRILAS